MSFAGLSAIGPGMQQGQMNLQSLQAKAQQIQQAQMAIDASKRELAAQASLFQGLPGGAQPPGNAAPAQTAGGQAPMGQQGPQPMPPGQSSQPGMQQPPGGGGAQMPPMPPQASPQGGPGMGAPPQQGGAPGAGGQDLSPQAQMQLLTQIAQGIKQRSPGIDPLTLFEAVKQQISLMGALSNTQKQQLVFAADQIKAQVSTSNTAMRVGAQERGQDIGAENVDKRVGASRDIAAGHDDTSRRNTDVRASAMLQATQARIQDADARLNQTQAAINARQGNSLQARAANKAQTERLKLMRDKVAQAKQTLASANASMDPAKIAAAQQAVDAALAQVTDFQAKVVRGAAAPAGDGQGKYTVGQIIDNGGKKYRVTGGDLNNDPDVELVP